MARLDGFDDHVFESLGKLGNLRGAIQLGSVHQTAGPREDRGDWVCGGLLALLPLAVVAGNGAVGSFCERLLAVWGGQYLGHQSQRSKALSNCVGLDVTVVVLTCPNIATLPLQRGCNHVVNEPVLIGQSRTRELVRVLGVENLLEGVLEGAVVGLQDGVLGLHVDGVSAG